MRRRVVASPSYALLLAVLVALTGCGGGSDDAVEVSPAGLSARDRVACEELVDRLPERLADQPSRPVTPADAPAAAWGDPAIVLRCGVGLPAEFGPAAACTNADGIDWFTPPEQFRDPDVDAVLTAVGARPVVEVTVPADYRPEGAAAVMSDLAEVMKALPKVRSCD